MFGREQLTEKHAYGHRFSWSTTRSCNARTSSVEVSGSPWQLYNGAAQIQSQGWVVGLDRRQKEELVCVWNPFESELMGFSGCMLSRWTKTIPSTPNFHMHTCLLPFSFIFLIHAPPQTFPCFSLFTHFFWSSVPSSWPFFPVFLPHHRFSLFCLCFGFHSINRLPVFSPLYNYHSTHMHTHWGAR